jgi:hypothetical protein
MEGVAEISLSTPDGIASRDVIKMNAVRTGIVHFDDCVLRDLVPYAGVPELSLRHVDMFMGRAQLDRREGKAASRGSKGPELLLVTGTLKSCNAP